MATDDVETRGLRGYLAGEYDGPGGEALSDRWDGDVPLCVDCEDEADMFTEGEWICDGCDDTRGADEGAGR